MRTISSVWSACGPSPQLRTFTEALVITSGISDWKTLVFVYPFFEHRLRTFSEGKHQMAGRWIVRPETGGRCFSNKSPNFLQPPPQQREGISLPKAFLPNTVKPGKSVFFKLTWCLTIPPSPIQPPLLSLQYSLLGFSLCSRLLFPSANDLGATT